MHKFFLIPFCYFFIISAYSQSRVGEWFSYTSHLDIEQSIQLGDTIVSATSGGILLYHQVSGKFEMMNNIEGLVTTDINSIAIDKNNHLWIGGASPNGVVQIYDLLRHESVAIFDFDLSEISNIAVSDSFAFVSYSQNQNWGILEFIWKDDAYRYRQIFNPSAEQLSFISGVAIRNDSLFVATDRGIFVGNYRDFILNYPQNWNLISEITDVVRIRKIGDELLVMSDGDTWSITDSLQLVSSTNLSLKDLLRLPDGTLYTLANQVLFKHNAEGEVVEYWRLDHKCNSITLSTDGNLIISTVRGLALWDVITETVSWYAPNSLASNVFTALTILDDGRLVAAGSKGVAILSEDGWYNLVVSTKSEAFHDFTTEDYSGFVADTIMYRTNRVWSVVERDGWIYYSLQGSLPVVTTGGDTIRGGLMSFQLENPGNFVIYDVLNSPLNPHSNEGSLNLRGLFVDDEKNLWISNFGADDIDKKITIFTADSQWIHIPQTGLSDKCYNPTDLLVLEEDGIFMVGSNEDHIRKGRFFVVEYEFSLTEDGRDTVLVDWHSFNSNDQTDDNTVWAQVVNESGTAWVLTPLGLRRLTFNESFTSATPYFFTYYSGIGFGEGSKIVSDGRENIWLNSTSNGLYVLLANSSAWPDWSGFHPDNSFLLSDEVLAVAFDNNRGIAYIATSKGINSLKIPFAEERKSYSSLRTFPSPFRIPSTIPMVIDGLRDETSLKIFTMSGRVLRTIKSTSTEVSGYQAFWDGRTDSGELVGTGIYLIAVYEPGGESLVTKVAVIRE